MEPTLKQAEFIQDDCLEAIYTGGGGAGKSTALLLSAWKYVNVPTYSALMLKRTYRQLVINGGWIDTIKQLIGDKVVFSKQQMRLTFPSGARIWFGYIADNDDVMKFAGGEWQGVFIDDVSLMPQGEDKSKMPYWYGFLLSRLRGRDVPLRMRLSNGTECHKGEWTFERFVSEHASGKRFIAGLRDNIYVDQATEMPDGRMRLPFATGTDNRWVYR